ncbi:MAG: DUF262 domain-containing protein [Candidatus Cloacimonetes bacterium]|nr:DUF262 domain-containing protein [Candidatus Cloacimonadota bacterium]
MASSYKNPIAVSELLDGIRKNYYLLPAIQRKFTWSHEQVCNLFDSLMRGYPINTFMFWEVADPNLLKSHKFYRVLDSYCERFNEDNPEHSVKGGNAFMAVIDGQQRITALNVGLRGSYSYKVPRKWWPLYHDETILPKRKLYLELTSKLTDDSDNNELQMEYNFKFLKKGEDKSDNGLHWFEVGSILTFPKHDNLTDAYEGIQEYLLNNGLQGNSTASKMLAKLYSLVYFDKSIHYYQETSQDTERVLDVFVRTNRGGTQLEYSDLLMSMAVAHWQGDAREKIDKLVSDIRSNPELGYSIDRDYVLKACLMLTGSEVKFKVKNLNTDVVRKIEKNWDALSKSIVATFKLVKSFGIIDQGLKAKNATIPIAYFLYTRQASRTKRLYEEINNTAKFADEKKTIRNWLFMSLLKQVFGGQGDSILTNLRKIIDKTPLDKAFPLEGIKSEYKGSPKDITFDTEFIDKLLVTQYEDQNCFTVLALLFQDLDYTKSIDKDHLHPKSAFKPAALKKHQFLQSDTKLMDFYQDKQNWNSVLNLHMLYSSVNKSKNGRALDQWINTTNVPLTKSDCLIDNNADLSFEKFREFIEDRKKLLTDKLKGLFS